MHVIGFENEQMSCKVGTPIAHLNILQSFFFSAIVEDWNTMFIPACVERYFVTVCVFFFKEWPFLRGTVRGGYRVLMGLK